MNDMVERVGAAIERAELAWKAENGGDAVSVVDCPNDVKARAAIEAMKQPTPEMIRAMVIADDFDTPSGICEEMYKTAISTAAEEGK